MNINISRKSPCFCGSGKKIKNCHHDIHPDSQAGRIYNFYHRLDTRIKEYYSKIDYSPKCHKGCNECCGFAFPITDSELDVIKYEMRKWKPQKLNLLTSKVEKYWNHLKDNYPSWIDDIEKNMTSTSINEASENLKYVKVPCVFLGEEGECIIYGVRPWICRSYGIAYSDSTPKYICSKLQADEVFTHGLDISSFKENIMEILSTNLGGDNVVRIRPKPILYSLYKAFFVSKKDLHIASYELRFQAPYDLYVDALKRHIQLSNQLTY